MRQIVLDTETTGLETQQGHRITEIGCLEIVDRRANGPTFHQYLNPDRDVDEAALEITGLSREFLSTQPRFPEVVDQFIEFITGAELIIHNAAFDVGFLDYELSRLPGERRRIRDIAGVVTDTLELAREIHPGMRNSLDALCRRYEVDNSRRDLHGALLDAELLAEVYLGMTGGQTALSLEFDQPEAESLVLDPGSVQWNLQVVHPTEQELQAHAERLRQIDETSGEGCLWLSLT